MTQKQIYDEVMNILETPTSDSMKNDIAESVSTLIYQVIKDEHDEMKAYVDNLISELE